MIRFGGASTGVLVGDFIKGLVNGRPLGIISVTEFGAKGDGITDDTSALQAALNAAASAGADVFIPPGRYIISSALVLPNKAIKVFGRGPKDRNDAVTPVSTIEQTQAGQGAFVINGASADTVRWPVLENLHIKGPGRATSTAVGIQVGVANQYSGDFVRIHRCIVHGFDVGIRFDGVAQAQLDHCSFIENNTNVWLATSILNSIQLINCNTSYSDTEIKISGGGGVQIIGGDHGNSTRHLDIRGGASVTLIGGNYERSLGTEFIYIEGSSLAIVGPMFRIQASSGGQDVPIVRAGAGGFVRIVSMTWNTTVPQVAKDHSSARIIALMPVKVSDAGQTYYSSCPEFIASSSEMSPDINLRGQMRFTAHTTPGNADRLAIQIKSRDGSARVYQLIQTEHYYSTSGDSHAYVDSMREYIGKVTFNLTPGQDFTNVTVNIGPFVTLGGFYGAVATVKPNGAAKAYAIVTNTDPTGGTVTFRVYHPDNTAGGSFWELSYIISVRI